MDRCALFVDAGYVLADGAMAVHGTRRGESVSWDYEGLLQLLSSLARERSGLPLLRCYWYDSSADGRRTAEHEALADLPGVKLRLAKVRPGRREGVETEIQRDLTTLARNNAVSDALVISAEDDLAQVIADVQDLGMRVTLVHIAVDGSWTISRTLRQESDDIIEISGEHLRPYVELIAGAEPALDDGDGSARSNGHLASVGAYQAAGNHVPPAIYTAPVVAEYQRPALQLPRATSRDSAREASREPTRELGAREAATREPARDERVREDRPAAEQAPEPTPAPGGQLRRLPTRNQARDAREGREAREARESRETRDARESREARDADRGRERDRDRDRDGDREREPIAPSPAQRSAAHSLPQHGTGAHGLSSSRESGRDSVRDTARDSGRDARDVGSRDVGSRDVGSRDVAGRDAGWENGREGAANGGPSGPSGANGPSAPSVTSGPSGAISPSARSAPYSGPQPVMPSGFHPQQSAVSLADAVQAAHEEGQDFGESVARDAPALWLEAVLARKPRMPSDLEARLLQGSALPIDFLLHDEVRHALRRGFWDALERTRR